MNNSKIKVEICAHTLTSALTAQEGGADRIELCAAIEVGGVTPSAATIIEARRLLNIEICVLIRPRSGDFCYSDTEFELIKKEIQFCKEQGIDGVVVGILTENQEIDEKRMAELLQIARPMQVVCHRAFDQTADAFKALEQLITLGYDRILTSGQKEGVVEGKKILQELVAQAKGRIAIMPGNGVTVDNSGDILEFTKAKDIHLTAKTLLSGKKKTSGNFFDMKAALNNNFYETDLEQVKKVVQIVKQLS